MAFLTKVRLGISAGQWVQTVSSFTRTPTANPTDETLAATMIEMILTRMGLLQRDRTALLAGSLSRERPDSFRGRAWNRIISASTRLSGNLGEQSVRRYRR